MKLVDLKVHDFLEELASKSAAPGGGSVSALSGASGASLVCMAGALTTKKKKFKALPEAEQKHYQNLIDFFLEAKNQFIDLIDKDTDSFNELMKAFKLPKEKESDIAKRNDAIELATIGCTKVPMEVATLANDCLKKMDTIVKLSNRNTISDQGVAVLSIYTAFTGAVMNVKTNLTGLNQKDLVSRYNAVIIDLINEVENLKDRLLDEISYLLK